MGGLADMNQSLGAGRWCSCMLNLWLLRHGRKGSCFRTWQLNVQPSTGDALYAIERRGLFTSMNMIAGSSSMAECDLSFVASR